MEDNKKYIVLDEVGNPIPRENTTEANPFIFYSLMEACKFAEKELNNQTAIGVAELVILERKERENGYKNHQNWVFKKEQEADEESSQTR